MPARVLYTESNPSHQAGKVAGYSNKRGAGTVLYSQIGRDILGWQAEQGWGVKVIDRLAHDLRTASADSTHPGRRGPLPQEMTAKMSAAKAEPATKRQGEVKPGFSCQGFLDNCSR